MGARSLSSIWSMIRKLQRATQFISAGVDPIGRGLVRAGRLAPTARASCQRGQLIPSAWRQACPPSQLGATAVDCDAPPNDRRVGKTSAFPPAALIVAVRVDTDRVR